LIGGLGIDKINWFDGVATLGYWLGEAYWRNGYMTEAASAALRFAFEELNLNRINVKAAIENTASNATIQKLGFVFEGIQRQNYRARATGELHDANSYELLKEDWLRRQGQQKSEKK